MMQPSSEKKEASVFLKDVPAFQRTLREWGETHFRSFPWRSTVDPYAILIAEVMLHRTQVRQVVPIYQRFIARYPDITSLAGAQKNDLESELLSLGLNWRVGLVYDMAQALAKQHSGQVPEGKAELLSLPGISEYIASAVRCFAWNLPDPIIDTNTVRVTGRLYGIVTKDSSRRNSVFRRLTGDLVDQSEPRAFNYALLDLAGLICTKRRTPACPVCPIRVYCVYGRNMFGETTANSTEQTSDNLSPGHRRHPWPAGKHKPVSDGNGRHRRDRGPRTKR